MGAMIARIGGGRPAEDSRAPHASKNLIDSPPTRAKMRNDVPAEALAHACQALREQPPAHRRLLPHRPRPPLLISPTSNFQLPTSNLRREPCPTLTFSNPPAARPCGLVCRTRNGTTGGGSFRTA